MPINITMPALSPTMEEGNLSKWLVKEGDKIAPGDVIAEIETDKATMEVEAVDEGTIAKLVVPAGSEGVKVNALIAILAEEGEDVAAAARARLLLRRQKRRSRLPRKSRSQPQLLQRCLHQPRQSSLLLRIRVTACLRHRLHAVSPRNPVSISPL